MFDARPFGTVRSAFTEKTGLISQARRPPLYAARVL